MRKFSRSALDKRAQPAAGSCALHGAVACELSASNYGKDQWWMLVRKS